jgi:hypothetical protein
VKRYRIATSLDPADGAAREEVFDVDADEFEIHARGVRVLTYSDDLEDLGRWGRLRLRLDGRERRRVNVAWVPEDTLLSIRQLPETETPGGAARSLSGSYGDRTRVLRAGDVPPGP